MADAGVFFDYTADPGARFPSQEVRDEIALLAPAFIEPGDIQTSQLADRSVKNPKIGIAGVESENLADAAVGTPQLADRSVTGPKAGIGTVTAVDANGNPIDLRIVVLTAAEMAGISTPMPGSAYLVLP